MILFVAAMQEEISEISKDLDPNVDVLLTGIGKVNAAMILQQYLSTHKVDKIINIGFAGGNNAYNVNDIVIIDEASYHDFDLSLFGYKKGQVPGYPESFHSDKNLEKYMISKLINAKKGHLFTGDYFMTKPVEYPAVFDMEGASLYHVAYQNHIPIISIKIISDVVGMEDHYQSYKTFEQTVGAHILFDIYKKIKEDFS
jgi:adenosylhomocysteine nucleosidase